MNEYGIINSRKRAIIALVHSVAFLGLALRSLARAAPTPPLWAATAPIGWSVGLLAMYLTVAGILVQLVRLSRCTRERGYFAFCASSATLGLLRTLTGDPGMHLALYLRVSMLLCAVATGALILRGYSTLPLATTER